jgi:hypothetical protein
MRTVRGDAEEGFDDTFEGIPRKDDSPQTLRAVVESGMLPVLNYHGNLNRAGSTVKCLHESIRTRWVIRP